MAIKNMLLLARNITAARLPQKIKRSFQRFTTG
jgi:hypothetical protein